MLQMNSSRSTLSGSIGNKSDRSQHTGPPVRLSASNIIPTGKWGILIVPQLLILLQSYIAAARG